MKPRRPPGRPRTRRSDLEAFTGYLEPRTLARLKALSELTGKRIWVLVNEALHDRWQKLSPAQRRRIEEEAAREEDAAGGDAPARG